MRISNYILTLCLAMIMTHLSSQESDSLGIYLVQQYDTPDGRFLNYRIMYPLDFPDGGPYPLIIFLHGAGERGEDNKRQLVHGSELFQDSLSNYPAVVLFPQCPRSDYWATKERGEKRGQHEFHPDPEPTHSLEMVMELISRLEKEPYIDRNRIYLAGLSMGGMGTWELLWRMPGTFAAAMPICGGGVQEKASLMTDVPIWAFHGNLDDVVFPRYSVSMVRAVQRAGGRAKISLYQDANHNSWDPAFAEPEFLRWMFSKSRSNNNE